MLRCCLEQLAALAALAGLLGQQKEKYSSLLLNLLILAYFPLSLFVARKRNILRHRLRRKSLLMMKRQKVKRGSRSILMTRRKKLMMTRVKKEEKKKCRRIRRREIVEQRTRGTRMTKQSNSVGVAPMVPRSKKISVLTCTEFNLLICTYYKISYYGFLFSLTYLC
jgi:hypothetical protein